MSTATKPKVATVRGTFLAPGVSKNGRLYTAENIARAVSRMQRNLESGSAPPISQLTSHGDDSVLSVVGRVTSVGQAADGSAWYVADVPDTSKGRDLATLLQHGYAGPVSIAGNWLGEVKREMAEDGRMVETADDLEVARIDYVTVPGVAAAGTPKQVTFEAGVPETDFSDETEGDVALIDEADSKAPYGNVTYADPGYQKDKKKRYPLDTEAHIRAAWNYINQENNASAYSPEDLAKVKAKIRAAMKRIGAQVSDSEQLPLIEASGGNSKPASASTRMQEHAEPPFAGATAVDPDQDGDVDGWACPTCGAIRPNNDKATNPDGDAMDTGQEHKETAVTEVAASPSNEAAAPARNLTDADIKALAEALRAPVAEQKPEEQKPETITLTREELDKRIAEGAVPLVRDELEKLRNERVGFPARRGVVTNREGGESKPFWEMSEAELRLHAREHAMSLPTMTPNGITAA